MAEEYQIVKSSKKNGASQSDSNKAEGGNNETPSNGSASSFIVVALSFKNPSYVKAEVSQDLKFDTKIAVDKDAVYYEENQIGKILEQRSVNDVKIDTSYDIKYTGGYSRDGKTIYLDKKFPKAIDVGDKKVDTVESIAKHHELTEKWLVDEGYDYQYAHIIATKIEREYVESLGVNWDEYSKEVEKHLHETYVKKLERSPKDLDISPYVTSKDTEALYEIIASTEK